MCSNRLISHERDPYSDHHIHCRVNEADAELVELDAGGVLFFCYGTPHATGDNATERDRAGLAYHFINVDYVPDGFFDQGRTGHHAHPRLTGSQASRGCSEYGENMVVVWERMVRASR